MRRPVWPGGHWNDAYSFVNLHQPSAFYGVNSLPLGANRQTFMGLAGMGDLILTCTGDLSRNRRVGLALAHDKSLAQILDELGHVAEGVYTAREVDQLSSRLGIDMPISAAVAAVLDGRLSAADALEQLMARDPKEEAA